MYLELAHKKSPLKKTAIKKTRRCLIGNQFSTSGFFLYVNFCWQFLLALLVCLILLCNY
jgi:hypothetical protein